MLGCSDEDAMFRYCLEVRGKTASATCEHRRDLPNSLTLVAHALEMSLTN